MTSSTVQKLPRWRLWRRRFYHRLLVVVLGLASRQSLENGRRWGRFLARLGLWLRPADRQRALTNIATAFPSMDTFGQEKLMKESVLALGDNFHDTLVAPKILAADDLVIEKTIQGRPSLGDELQQLVQQGRGVLILTGHLGCWELLGGWLAREVRNAGLGGLATVTGTIHNAPVDQLVQDRRRALGLFILPRNEGAAPLLRHLRQGSVAAVLLDQNTKVENLPVSFFGQEAPTPSGFARIALRYGVPILPVAMARRGRGHEVSRGDIRFCTAGGPETGNSVAELLLWCNHQLEAFIVRNPAEWVWFHQRWDDSPSDSIPARDQEKQSS